jgi:MFS superfamily sulfate permease-like transporter
MRNRARVALLGFALAFFCYGVSRRVVLGCIVAIAILLVVGTIS